MPARRPTGPDRLRAPLRRVAEIAAHARRVGPWRDAVLRAVPDADIFSCKALIALPVIRSAARRTGGRFVYDIADVHTEAARLARMPGWFRALVRRAERAWMREAAGLTAASPDLADEVVRVFGVERPIVVLNCPHAWRPDETMPARTGRLREIAGIGPDRPLVLYQGGFSVDRGIEELVGALGDPRLVARDVVGVFLGYGRLRSWLDEQVARQPGRILVIDAVPPDELPEYTADADVGFVGQPPRTLNHRLNLANKFFEYLQAGVPVIAAAGTAHCRLTQLHVVGGCVEIDTPSTIADAIDELIGAEPEARERLRAHARSVALEQYTWEHHRVNVIELYRKLEGRSNA